MSNWLKELWKFRELLFALTTREIKVRYKQTLLGASWALIQPLSLMLIFTVVFGVFLKVNSEGIPYPLFYYSALLPWTFFATSLSFGSLAVVNNGNLVSKVYFPRETLPFASILAAFLDFLVAAAIFAVMIFLYKVPVGIELASVVLILAVEVIFTAACVLLASSINVIWRDVKFIVPLLLQLWLFATPIIYPITAVPIHLRFFYQLNPMVGIVDNFRRVTVQNEQPDWTSLLIAFAISTVFFIGAYVFFKKQERIFADVI